MATIVRPTGKAKLIHAVDEAWGEDGSILIRTMCGRNTKGVIDADADAYEISCAQCEKAMARVYIGPTVDLTDSPAEPVMPAQMDAATDAMREAMRREMLREVGEAPDSLADETAEAIKTMKACSPTPLLYGQEPAAPVLGTPEVIREPRPKPQRTAGQTRHAMVRYQRAQRRQQMKEVVRNAN